MFRFFSTNFSPELSFSPTTKRTRIVESSHSRPYFFVKINPFLGQFWSDLTGIITNRLFCSRSGEESSKKTNTDTPPYPQPACPPPANTSRPPTSPPLFHHPQPAYTPYLAGTFTHRRSPINAPPPKITLITEKLIVSV